MRRFFSVVISVVCFAVVLIGVILAFVGLDTGDNSAIVAGSVIAIVFLALHFIKTVSFKKRHIAKIGIEAYNKEIAAKHEKKNAKRIKRAEKRKENQRKAETKMEKRRIRNETVRANTTIDYVVIAGSESKTSTGSAIARGAVGRALLGPVGMLAAAGAKKNSFVELVVRYKSGRTETVKVKFDSKEFKNYAKYIR